MSTGADYQAIADLCEREGWNYGLEGWNGVQPGACLTLYSPDGHHQLAEVFGESMRDLRRRVDNQHASVLQDHDGKVPPAAMMPPGDDHIDIAKVLAGVQR